MITNIQQPPFLGSGVSYNFLSLSVYSRFLLCGGIRNLGGDWVKVYIIVNYTTPNYCFNCKPLRNYTLFKVKYA